MKTVVDLDGSLDALLAHIRKTVHPFGYTFVDEALTISLYCFDDRIGWNTYLVTLEGYGPVGFTDGPLLG